MSKGLKKAKKYGKIAARLAFDQDLNEWKTSLEDIVEQAWIGCTVANEDIAAFERNLGHWSTFRQQEIHSEAATNEYRRLVAELRKNPKENPLRYPLRYSL